MGKRKFLQLDLTKKTRIIEEYNLVGYQPSLIAKTLREHGYGKLVRTTVARFLTKYIESGTISRKSGSGRPKKITPTLLTFIQQEMEISDETTGNDLSRALEDGGVDENVSTRTVLRARKDYLNWEYMKTQYCQSIREPNVLHRKQWCQEMMSGPMQQGYDFDDIICVDESKIERIKDCDRSCRRKGQAIKRKGKHKHPVSVMVWAGISKRGRTHIKIFDKGTMDANYYCQILEEAFIPFANTAYGPQNYKLWQDNDPKHKSKRCTEFYDQNGIIWFRTPAESPDLNPIENIWKDMKWWLAKHWKPDNLQDLIDGIIYYWDNEVTQEVCIKYINSLHKVIPDIVSANGLPCGH